MAIKPEGLSPFQSNTWALLRLYRKTRLHPWTLTELRESYPDFGIPPDAQGVPDLSVAQSLRLYDRLVFCAVVAEAIAHDLGLMEMPECDEPRHAPFYLGDEQNATFARQ